MTQSSDACLSSFRPWRREKKAPEKRR